MTQRTEALWERMRTLPKQIVGNRGNVNCGILCGPLCTCLSTHEKQINPFDNSILGSGLPERSARQVVGRLQRLFDPLRWDPDKGVVQTEWPK